MTRLVRLALRASLGLLTATGAASAGGGEFGINIDVHGSFFSARPVASYGAAAGQPGFWNVILTGTTTPVALNNLNGIPSGVTATRLFGNVASATSCVGGFVNVNWSALMCDYGEAAVGVVNPVEYVFDGLPAGEYQIFTYGAHPGEEFAPSFLVGVWVNDVWQGGEFIGGPVLVQQFTEGVTHTIHTVSVPGGADVRVRLYDNSGEFGDPTYLNGFQIVQIGEPNASISSPGFISCVCDPVTIAGVASGAGFAGYWLDYSTTGNDPWMPITSSGSPVTNATLGVWNTAGLAEGYYTIRLTVQTGSGATSTAVTTVYLSQDVNIAEVAGPQTGDVVGGLACVGGSVLDNCLGFYRVNYIPEPDGQELPVDPDNPSYPKNEDESVLAVWDTTAVPDGSYTIRLRAQTTCGQERMMDVQGVIVDNTPPVAAIDSPTNCASACGLIDVFGTATDANFDRWVLQYTGGAESGWVTIAQGTSQVSNGLIAQWDTAGLEPCAYTLRLIAYSDASINCGNFSQATEVLASVNVGDPADIDGDGDVDFDDLGLLLGAFGSSGCF